MLDFEDETTVLLDDFDSVLDDLDSWSVVVALDAFDVIIISADLEPLDVFLALFPESVGDNVGIRSVGSAVMVGDSVGMGVVGSEEMVGARVGWAVLLLLEESLLDVLALLDLPLCIDKNEPMEGALS